MAIAFDFDGTQWPDDSQRPLTPEGQKRFRRSARGLKVLVGTCGPGAQQSLGAGLAEPPEFSTAKPAGQRPMPCEALELGRARAEVLQALQPFIGYQAIGLVGHEPSLHELVVLPAHRRYEPRPGRDAQRRRRVPGGR